MSQLVVGRTRETVTVQQKTMTDMRMGTGLWGKDARGEETGERGRELCILTYCIHSSVRDGWMDGWMDG